MPSKKAIEKPKQVRLLYCFFRRHSGRWITNGNERQGCQVDLIKSEQLAREGGRANADKQYYSIDSEKGYDKPAPRFLTVGDHWARRGVPASAIRPARSTHSAPRLSAVPACAIGRVMLNVLPSPSWLSTVMSPPCKRTISREMYRPTPSPLM